MWELPCTGSGSRTGPQGSQQHVHDGCPICCPLAHVRSCEQVIALRGIVPMQQQFVLHDPWMGACDAQILVIKRPFDPRLNPHDSQGGSHDYCVAWVIKSYDCHVPFLGIGAHRKVWLLQAILMGTLEVMHSVAALPIQQHASMSSVLW